MILRCYLLRSRAVRFSQYSVTWMQGPLDRDDSNSGAKNQPECSTSTANEDDKACAFHSIKVRTPNELRSASVLPALR